MTWAVIAILIGLSASLSIAVVVSDDPVARGWLIGCPGSSVWPR